MRISDRFIDYGTTGAFFLIGQFILLAIWNQLGWINNLEIFAQHIPPQLQSTVGSLLTVVGIIGIFFVGLLLNMFGPLFRLLEMRNFRVHLIRNRDWLLPLANRDEYVKKGLEDFSGSNILLEWNDRLEWKNYRKEVLQAWFPFLKTSDLKADNTESKHMTLSRGYSRLRYFFPSFILMNSGITQPDDLVDQTHLWRTSRAISTATAIWAIEPFIGLLIWLVELPLAPQMLPSSYFTILIFLGIWVVLVTLTYVTMRLALVTYSQMCSIMFSLAHLTYKKVFLNTDISLDEKAINQVNGERTASDPKQL